VVTLARDKTKFLEKKEKRKEKEQWLLLVR